MVSFSLLVANVAVDDINEADVEEEHDTIADPPCCAPITPSLSRYLDRIRSLDSEEEE